MVSIRFKYMAVLCGLILGNSILALTPGVRAKIMDLTRDIKNKKISNDEARKRALALKISPKDMNDNSINTLFITAENAGIADIMNPAMAAETKSATTVSSIKTRPVTQEEKPVLQQEPAPQKITDPFLDAALMLATLDQNIEVFATNTHDTLRYNKPGSIDVQTLENTKKRLDSLFSEFDTINKNIKNLETNYGKQPKTLTDSVAYISKKLNSAQENYEKIISEQKNEVQGKLKTVDQEKAAVTAQPKQVTAVNSTNLLIDTYADMGMSNDDIIKLMNNASKETLLGASWQAYFVNFLNNHNKQTAEDIKNKIKEILEHQKWSVQEIVCGYLTLLGIMQSIASKPKDSIDSNDVDKALRKFLAKTIDGKTLSGVMKPYSGEVSFAQVLDNYSDTYLNPAKISTQQTPKTSVNKPAYVQTENEKYLEKYIEIAQDAIKELEALNKKATLTYEDDARSQVLGNERRGNWEKAKEDEKKHTTKNEDTLFSEFTKLYKKQDALEGKIQKRYNSQPKQSLADFLTPAPTTTATPSNVTELIAITKQEQDLLAERLKNLSKEITTLVNEYANKLMDSSLLQKLIKNIKNTSDDGAYDKYIQLSAQEVINEIRKSIDKKDWTTTDIIFEYLRLLDTRTFVKNNPKSGLKSLDITTILQEFLSRNSQQYTITDRDKADKNLVYFVQIIDNNKKQYLDPNNVSVFSGPSPERFPAKTPAPTTTAGIAPGVTTTGVSTTDIKPYVNVANRTYTPQQIQEYAARLKEKGNTYSIFIDQEQFKKLNNQDKENDTLRTLYPILDPTLGDGTFNGRLYKIILPHYYEAKQKLAIHPSPKGQELLEKVLMKELKNDQGQPFNIGQYIDSFEQGYLK